MHILLMSAGGGGGNILRSVMATFRRDLAVTQKTDPRHAERLRTRRDHSISGHQRVCAVRFAQGGAVPHRRSHDRPSRREARPGGGAPRARGITQRSRGAVQPVFDHHPHRHGRQRHRFGHDVSTGADRASAEEARDPDLRSAIVRAARSGQAALRPRGTRDRAIRRSGHPADRDSERPRIRGTRSAAAAGRLGTNERSDRARSPRPDLRPVGSLAGRSVRSLDPVCRQGPSANRLRRDRSSGRLRSER